MSRTNPVVSRMHSQEGAVKGRTKKSKSIWRREFGVRQNGTFFSQQICLFTSGACGFRARTMVETKVWNRNKKLAISLKERK